MRTVEDHDDLTVLDAVESTTSGGSTVVRWVSALMSAGLISVLAWQAAGLTWRTVAPTESIQAAPQWTSRALVPPTSARSDAQREAQLKTIMAAQLFGVAELTEVSKRAEAPPETPLDLRLKGIVYTDVAADARAIIADPSGPQFAYANGDTLPGDARIAEIRREYVVLERNGLKETLRLEQHKQQANGGGRAPTPDRRYDERGNFALAKMLGGFQARLKTDPAAALSLVRLVQQKNGENVIGVKVFPGPERGFLERVALQPGDLITHVNGIAISSTANGLEALREITAATELDLQVKRGERRLSLSFSVAQ